jgi:uncharacterized protein (DUF433 family)
MLDWSTCPAVEKDSGRMSGAWVFRGSRVPVKTLFDNLDAGASVDEFLEWFEGITPWQVHEVLTHASRDLQTAVSD